MRRGTQLLGAIGDNQGVKDQLQRAKQALEAEPAIAAEPGAAAEKDAGGGAAAGAGLAGKAQARAKKADGYHARHAAWVHEFNALTGGECAGGDGGVAWAAVRAWQQKHWQVNNLLADGLVGPKTLEAAKLVAKQAGGANDPKQDAAGAKDTGGGADDKAHVATGEHAASAGAPGAADGAEASADKPKLDDEEGTPAVDAKLDATASASATAKPSAAKKQATVEDFKAAIQAFKEVAAAFHDSKDHAPREPITESRIAGKGDPGAPNPEGAMLSKGALGDYKSAADKLTKDWGKLSPHGRAAFVVGAANEALSQEQVPAVKPALEGIPNPAHFEHDRWIIAVNQESFEKSGAAFEDKDREIHNLASDVFHEGRHAEQRFTLARQIANQDPKATELTVAHTVKIPQSIAAQAVAMRKQPLEPAQAKAAGSFAKDVVDHPQEHGAAEQAAPLVSDTITKAYRIFNELKPEERAAVAAQWQECRARAIEILDAYYNLATERDAYASEQKLGIEKR